MSAQNKKNQDQSLPGSLHVDGFMWALLLLQFTPQQANMKFGVNNNNNNNQKIAKMLDISFWSVPSLHILLLEETENGLMFKRMGNAQVCMNTKDCV